MEVDHGVATSDHLGEKVMGDARGTAAGRVAGEKPVEVATVGQVARSAREAREIDDRHADHGSHQFRGVQRAEYTADHLDAVQFVAVDRASQAQDRARLWAVYDRDRNVHRIADEAGTRAPRHACPRARLHALSEQLERRIGRRRCVRLGRSRHCGVACGCRPLVIRRGRRRRGGVCLRFDSCFRCDSGIDHAGPCIDGRWRGRGRVLRPTGVSAQSQGQREDQQAPWHFAHNP